MKRIWLALTAFTAGVWLLVLRRGLRKPKSEALMPQSVYEPAPTYIPAPVELSLSLSSLVRDQQQTRRLLQNAGLAVFGVIVGLLIVWLGARVFLPPRPQPQLAVPSVAVEGCEPAPGDWAAGVSAAGLVLSPCRDYFWRDTPFDEFYYNVQLNNLGLHDTMLTLEKPAGVFRILVVGDSYPAGEEVPLTNGFPYLLERQLRLENDGSRSPVEVINLSVPAIGTDRELLLYAGLGWRFQADVVVLCVYTGNDIQDNDIAMEQLRYGYRLNRPFFTFENGALQLHNSQITLDAQLFPDSPAWQWFANMQAQQTTTPTENVPTRPLVISRDPYVLEYPVELGIYLPADDYWTRAWSLTEQLLLQFRTLVEAQGSRFAVMIIPDRRAVHQEDWEATLQDFPIAQGGNPLGPVARLALFTQQNGIAVLNLTTALRTQVSESPQLRLYYAGDGHLNVPGHFVAAQALHDWLQEQGLLPTQ